LNSKGDGSSSNKIAERTAIKCYENDFDYTQYKGFNFVSETQDLYNAVNVYNVYSSFDEN
jgi:hypothetical protein